MSRLKVCVAELHPELEPGSPEWESLAARASEGRPDLFLLAEMPFGPWIAAGSVPDEKILEKSRRLHAEGISRLGQLGARVVLGTRPADQNGKSVNEAFVWTGEGEVEGVHTKQFFPDEEGYYEARWFQAGERHFRVVKAGEVRLGFLICTELMFNEHARHYGRGGAQVLAVPRAVGKGSLGRWLVAMRMAAIVSGCYVLSSNRSGVDSQGQEFGGCGWIIDPAGDLVAQTSVGTPVVFHEMDLDRVARAQKEYPCYVPEDR